MDIKDKVSPEDKTAIGNLSVELQVLRKLFAEREGAINLKAQEVLSKIGLSPKLYNLNFRVDKDVWEAVLKESALVIPGGAAMNQVNRGRN